MAINHITGYDINKDECGECRNTSSHLFLQPLKVLKEINDFYDESEKLWMYSPLKKQKKTII
jgi:hypothetical protein